jgi:hypothetical protein
MWTPSSFTSSMTSCFWAFFSGSIYDAESAGGCSAPVCIAASFWRCTPGCAPGSPYVRPGLPWAPAHGVRLNTMRLRMAIETIALIAMYLTIISIPPHQMVRNDCVAVTYVAPRGGEYPGLPARAIIAADGSGLMTADLFRFHVFWPTSGRSLAARLCVAWPPGYGHACSRLLTHFDSGQGLCTSF